MPSDLLQNTEKRTKWFQNSNSESSFLTLYRMLFARDRPCMYITIFFIGKNLCILTLIRTCLDY